MAIRVEVEATYEGDADAIFAAALDFREMQEAMRGLAVYEGLPDAEVEEGRTYEVDVTIWHVLRNRGHRMHVERLDRAARVIESRESGGAIRRWDHTLSVQTKGDRVRWSDHVIIDAGWQTWPTSRFAGYVYRRRHRHRQALSITCRYLPA